MEPDVITLIIYWHDRPIIEGKWIMISRLPASMAAPAILDRIKICTRPTESSSSSGKPSKFDGCNAVVQTKRETDRERRL